MTYAEQIAAAIERSAIARGDQTSDLRLLANEVLTQRSALDEVIRQRDAANNFGGYVQAAYDALSAETDELRTEVASLRAVTTRVRELHRPVNEKFANGDIRAVCAECNEGEFYPCPTVRTLDRRAA